jgi:hypothetical protein
MEEDSGPSLASGIFSRSDSKTQTQYLTISTPPDEFNLQLNVALLVDFLKGWIKRPLLNVGPKFKRRIQNNFSGVIARTPLLEIASVHRRRITFRNQNSKAYSQLAF